MESAAEAEAKKAARRGPRYKPMTGRASPAPTPTQASPRDVAVDDEQQTPRHGLVYRVGSKRKDEDRAVAGEHVTCGGERFAYFAIFDGHGGKDAADRCQATLHDQISRRAPDTTKATDALSEGLRRACWELDEDLGSAHVDAGTTATILCIGRSTCLLYTSPSPRDQRGSRMPSSA